ncbi:MAG: DEAD/DEAH box helicase [Patescibacteria group bacterium]
MSENNEKQDPSFSQLGISPAILTVLGKMKFSIPTPIQREAIPVAILGQDLIGVAQTGTGKTLAFGIPMIQRLPGLHGRGLVLLPTRELALQVEENLRQFGGAFGMKTVALIGGQAISNQIFALKRKPDIIIATPGRLIDHIKRRTVRLDDVKVLVLDEADMMFDMGFAPQIEEVLASVPKLRQTMLFSATMPPAIVKLAAKHLKTPIHIEMAPSGTTAKLVDQEMYVVKKEDKFIQLEKILKNYQGSVLIFTRTKHGAANLTKSLIGVGQKAVEIHSNLSFGRRRLAMADFKSKKSRILVATDIAARGIDVSGIELVVNYNLPDNSEDYVHRIGRTGRAGLTGKAISFATPDQLKDIRSIEKVINKTFNLTKFAELDRSTVFSSHSKSGRRTSFNRNNSFGSSRPASRSSSPLATPTYRPASRFGGSGAVSSFKGRDFNRGGFKSGGARSSGFKSHSKSTGRRP